MAVSLTLKMEKNKIHCYVMHDMAYIQEIKNHMGNYEQRMEIYIHMRHTGLSALMINPVTNKVTMTQ